MKARNRKWLELLYYFCFALSTNVWQTSKTCLYCRISTNSYGNLSRNTINKRSTRSSMFKNWMEVVSRSAISPVYSRSIRRKNRIIQTMVFQMKIRETNKTLPDLSFFCFETKSNLPNFLKRVWCNLKD